MIGFFFSSYKCAYDWLQENKPFIGEYNASRKQATLENGTQVVLVYGDNNDYNKYLGMRFLMLVYICGSRIKYQELKALRVRR